jgi:hypothetical protein
MIKPDSSGRAMTNFVGPSEWHIAKAGRISPKERVLKLPEPKALASGDTEKNLPWPSPEASAYGSQ